MERRGRHDCGVGVEAISPVTELSYRGAKCGGVTTRIDVHSALRWMPSPVVAGRNPAVLRVTRELRHPCAQSKQRK